MVSWPQTRANSHTKIMVKLTQIDTK